MSERTAIVIGGGIGGLAAAAGLCRAGWRVTVFEQAPRFAPVGAGIALAPNAVRALDWLGVGDALRECSVATGAAGVRTPSGRWLLRTTVEQLTARHGVPAYVLHRADLHRMLAEASARADLRTGHRVTGVGGGEVRFVADGRSGTAWADLVVAADGVHSLTRRVLFPGHPGPAYAGEITWRGLAPADAAPAGLPGAFQTLGRGQGFGALPLADGRVYWFADRTAPEGAHTGDDLAAVAARFAGWHDPVPALLAATPPDALLRHDIYHLATPLPSYVAGRVALLGDAAHAMTPALGQGACQALEDAVVLTALAAGSADLATALAAYDRARRRRTQGLVRASARAGRLLNPGNALAAQVRDVVTWALPTAAFLRATSGTFGWQTPARPHLTSPTGSTP
ncbi:FAD-dependent monooxygenase [Nonomuraea sp. NPDC049480]|uniref:FAD-dependent monooxygenase n=1 Tax=Nonomuraea sp. NPDC049480 TaxID=3364353 RepID=UPI0037A31D13